MMGSAVHLHVSACGTDTIMIVQTMDIGENTAFPIGSSLSFSFGGHTAHVFRPRDGREPGAAEDGIGSIFIMKTESCCRAGFFCKKENSGYGKEYDVMVIGPVSIDYNIDYQGNERRSWAELW